MSADLSVTPRKVAGDEHVTSSVSRNGRNNPKSTSTGSLMGAVRAAAAGRKSKKEYRRSGDGRGEPGPGVRVSGQPFLTPLPTSPSSASPLSCCCSVTHNLSSIMHCYAVLHAHSVI